MASGCVCLSVVRETTLNKTTKKVTVMVAAATTAASRYSRDEGVHNEEKGEKRYSRALARGRSVERERVWVM